MNSFQGAVGVTLGILGTLVAAGASGAGAPGRRPAERIVLQFKASPTHLRFSGGVLHFCEGGRPRVAIGGRIQDGDAAVNCAVPDESNASCSGIAPEVAVRSPAGEADDIVDWEAWSLPVMGRVHDCAAIGRTAIVATGSRVVLADLDTQTATILARQGADRVAIAADGLAWARGRRIVLTSERR